MLLNNLSNLSVSPGLVPLSAGGAPVVQQLGAGQLQVPLTDLQQLQALCPGPHTQAEQLLHLQGRNRVGGGWREGRKEESRVGGREVGKERRDYSSD